MVGLDKKSEVMRIPRELVERINIYEKCLGIKMGKADVMRNFANEAITPRDNLASALSRLNEASKKKL